MTNVTIVAFFSKKMVGQRQKRNRNVENVSLVLYGHCVNNINVTAARQN